MRLRALVGQQPDVDIVLPPVRGVSDECLRVILAAYRRGASIEVL